MALTVPPPTSSLTEFGWIFHNNHLDSSIYQDDDIMEFSDSSAEYQTPPYQQHQQPQQQQVSVNVYPKNTRTHFARLFQAKAASYSPNSLVFTLDKTLEILNKIPAAQIPHEKHVFRVANAKGKFD